MSEKLLFTCTHAKDDPERAILPFVAANTAAVAGLEAVVLLTIEGVWLGTTGGTEGIEKDGFPQLTSLYEEFVANGGEVWLCGTCAKPRAGIVRLASRIAGMSVFIVHPGGWPDTQRDP